jgi:hypothetical protein
MDFEAQLDVQPTMWSVWVIGSSPIDIPKVWDKAHKDVQASNDVRLGFESQIFHK